MRLLLLLLASASSAAEWNFRPVTSADAAAADGRSGYVFWSWAGGSFGCCSCRGGWWLQWRLVPLRLLLLLVVSVDCGCQQVRPLLWLVFGVATPAGPTAAASVIGS